MLGLGHLGRKKFREPSLKIKKELLKLGDDICFRVSFIAAVGSIFGSILGYDSKKFFAKYIYRVPFISAFLYRGNSGMLFRQKSRPSLSSDEELLDGSLYRGILETFGKGVDKFSVSVAERIATRGKRDSLRPLKGGGLEIEQILFLLDKNIPGNLNLLRKDQWQNLREDLFSSLFFREDLGQWRKMTA